MMATTNEISDEKVRAEVIDDPSSFILSAPAGSGKTTVISEMFKNPVHSHKKIVLSATTNKAVSVIDQMVSDRFSNRFSDRIGSFSNCFPTCFTAFPTPSKRLVKFSDRFC